MKKSIYFIFLMLFICMSQNAFGGRNSACGGDVSSLELSMDNSENHRVHSDNGIYTTGKGKGSNTSVKFLNSDCSYDLEVNLSRSSRNMFIHWPLPYSTMVSKTFSIDRAASVPVTDWNSDEFKAFCGYTLDVPNVVPAEGERYLFDNYAGCGKDPDTFDDNGNVVEGKYFVRRAAIFSVEGYEMRFQNPMEDGLNPLGSGTSYIRVYRPDAANYEMSPEEAPISATEPARAALTYSYNNQPAYIKDQKPMPFRFSLRKF